MTTQTDISLSDWQALVAECNAILLGLGAPIERDDMGYNKADFGPCLSAGLMPEDDLVVDVAERLPKYHRQIGKDRVELIREGLRLHSGEFNRTKGRVGVSATRCGDQATVFFKYNQRLLDILRAVVPSRERKFNYDRKCWSVPLSRLTELADAMDGEANTAALRNLVGTLHGDEIIGKVGADTDKLLVRIAEKDGELIISHRYDDDLRAVYRACRLFWDGQDKAYHISRKFNGWGRKAKAVLDALLTCGDDVEIEGIDILRKWADAPKTAAQTATPSSKLLTIDEVTKGKATPFPFQRDGIDFIRQTNYRCILADDMGLGKTNQAIIAAAQAGYRTLVVCPAGVKRNWAREVELFTNLSAYVANTSDKAAKPIHGTERCMEGGPSGDFGSHRFVIINGDLLIDKKVKGVERKSKWTDLLIARKFDMVIVDESQFYKNWKAKRTQKLCLIAKNISRRVLLSGTPIKSRPAEIYSQLRLVAPAIAGKWLPFAERFCEGHYEYFGTRAIFVADGASNLGELRQRMSPVFLRRTKEEVLPDLPGKLRTVVSVPLPPGLRRQYDKAAADYVDYLHGIGDSAAAVRAARAEHLTRINGLKQLVLKAKIDAAIEFAKNANEQGRKVVVFSQFTEVIDAVKAVFGDSCVTFRGSDDTAARDDAVRTFQDENSGVMVFAGNAQAAGIGITLTASSLVFFVDLLWTPADIMQPEDRCCRIGQKNCVNVYFAIAEDTIDEWIYELLLSKMDVLGELLDGRKPAEFTNGGTNILDELVARIRSS